MSHMAEVDKDEDVEFKWGKKRGLGGKKKEVQFYESFTYDGVDYTLHDCVYMYKEGEPEPYIGKLIKIWENPDKSKKVKVHWFFHRSEILDYLGDKEVLENELLLASGEGVGATNVNPLEAIAHKCNVVCISKDIRNPQPSEQELQIADYIFYRTFDVKHRTISDKIDDKIAGLEVKFVFNRKESENISSVPKLDIDKNEESVARSKILQLSGKNPLEKFKTTRLDGSSIRSVPERSEGAKDSSVERKSLLEGKPFSGVAIASDDMATRMGRQGTVLRDRTARYGIDLDKNEIKMSEVLVDHVEVEDKVKISKESGALEKNLSEKSMVDASVKLSENKSMNNTKKLNVHGNDVKATLTPSSSLERKTKTGLGKDFVQLDKGVKLAKDMGVLEDKPSKKARIDYGVKFSENKDNNNVQKLSINSHGNGAKDLTTTLISGEKTKSKVASVGPDKDPKQKTDKKMTKLSKGELLKVSVGDSSWRKAGGDVFEITRRPDDERNRWFREIPWEERMKRAHELGTLVQLLNLDPECTSGEVEDIVWGAFKENCSAKMVQRTAISSPHYGQAFIILKTREAAKRIIKELDNGCLMLSNGRPLVGRIAPSGIMGKQSTFVGHLFVDNKIKHQMQREMKEAVSTSHCSQPNTIEYDMAMEWRLLQSKSDSWWKLLYKQQGDELRKLKASLKLK